jgi:hypothetical protein
MPTKLSNIDEPLNVRLLKNLALFGCQASGGVEFLRRRCVWSLSVLIVLLTSDSSMAMLVGRIGASQSISRRCVLLALFLLGACRPCLVDDAFIDIDVGLVEGLNLGLAR